MQIQLLLVVVGSVGFASALNHNVGPCTVNVDTVTSFKLDQFANENDGVWSYKLVPNTHQYKPVDWMFLNANPLASSGVYQTGLFSQKHGAEPEILNQLLLVDLGGGVVEAKPVYSNGTAAFKWFFLTYHPGKFAYFYVCSDDGGNDKVDSRFVVSHGKLTTAQKTEIKGLDTDFGFKGNLRHLVEGEANLASHRRI